MILLLLLYNDNIYIEVFYNVFILILLLEEGEENEEDKKMKKISIYAKMKSFKYIPIYIFCLFYIILLILNLQQQTYNNNLKN
jgi:hypothetical protein